MNIFVLDTDPNLAARYHCDRHVVKMILESVQLINTAINISHNTQIGYKSTHINHPCSIWARESLDNCIWLAKLTKALNSEYKYRYNKLFNHKSYDHLIKLPEPNIPALGLTPFPLAMPDHIKEMGQYDPVRCYRLYYFLEKKPILKYTKRSRPKWLSEMS